MIKKIYFNVYGPEEEQVENQNTFSLNFNTETKEFYAVDTTVPEEPASEEPGEQPVSAATPVFNQLTIGTLDAEGGERAVVLSAGENISIDEDVINCTLTGLSQLTNDAGFITVDQLPSSDGEPVYYTAGEGLALSGTQFRLTASIPTYTAGYGLSLDNNEFSVAIPIPTSISSFNASDTKLYLQHMGFAINDYIPTNLSHLNNDVGFITLSSVPTNVSELTNDVGFITINDIPEGTVYVGGAGISVANNTISLTASIPTKVSDLTNDVGYITHYNNAITALTISGRNIRWTKQNGTSGTLTTQDTNYAAGTSANILNNDTINKVWSGRTINDAINSKISNISGSGSGLGDFNSNEYLKINELGRYLSGTNGISGYAINGNSGYIFGIDYDWLSNNFSNGDGNNTEINNRISSLNTTVNTLSSNVRTLSTNLTANVRTLSTNLTATVRNVSTLSSNLQSLSSQVQNINAGSGNPSGGYDNSALSAVSAQVVINKNHISTISANYAKASTVTILTANINTLSSNLQSLSSQVQNINAGSGYNNPTTGGYDNSALSAVSAQVNTNKTNISTVSADLTSAKLTMNSMNNRINTISSNYAKADVIENINNDIQHLNDRIDNLNYSQNISGDSNISGYSLRVQAGTGLQSTNSNSGYVFSIDENWLNYFNNDWINGFGKNAAKNAVGINAITANIAAISSKLNSYSNSSSGANNINFADQLSGINGVSGYALYNNSGYVFGLDWNWLFNDANGWLFNDIASHWNYARKYEVSELSTNLTGTINNINRLSTNLTATIGTVNMVTGNVKTLSSNLTGTISRVDTISSNYAKKEDIVTYSAGRFISLSGANNNVINCILTGVSELTNDAGYITRGQLPENLTGVTYTAGVGLTLNQDNQFSLTAQIPPNFTREIGELSTNLTATISRVNTITGNINTISTNYLKIHDFSKSLSGINGISGFVKRDIWSEEGRSGYVFGIDQNWFNNKINDKISAQGGVYSAGISANIINRDTVNKVWSGRVISDAVQNKIRNNSYLTSSINSLNTRINNTITALTVAGKIITYTKASGTTGTITTQDTTYSAGTSANIINNDAANRVWPGLAINQAITNKISGYLNSIPTAVSELVNDAQYITRGQLPDNLTGVIYTAGYGLTLNQDNQFSLTAQIPDAITSLTASGKNITWTKKSGTTGTITTQDTTYTAGISANIINNDNTNKVWSGQAIHQAITGKGYITNYNDAITALTTAGKSVTYTRKSGTTGMIITQDTTYGAGTSANILNNDLTNRVWSGKTINDVINNKISSYSNNSSGTVYTAGYGLALDSNNTFSLTATIPTKVSDLTNDVGYLTTHQSLANYVTTSGLLTVNNNLSTAINTVDTKVANVSAELTSFNHIVENNWIIVPVSASVEVQNNRRYICLTPANDVTSTKYVKLSLPSNPTDGFKFGVFIEGLGDRYVRIGGNTHDIKMGSTIIDHTAEEVEDKYLILDQKLIYVEFMFMSSDNYWHVVSLSMPAANAINIGDLLMAALQSDPTLKAELKQELGIN